MTQTYIQDSCGVPHETTLYNLNVLNQLAMVCIDKEVSEKQRALLSGIVVDLILSAYLRTWCALIFHSSTKRYFETCVPARTKEVVMSKWTILTVAALSVSAGIFLLCSVSSLIRDFEDAFSYED